MAKVLKDEDVVHAGDEVYAVSGSNTNWVIIKEGHSCTLVDSGYPADYDTLLASLNTLGLAPESVAAVLITHAHNDHIGAAERLHVAFGIPVLMHEAEVPHARRDFLDQVSIGKVLGQAWRPGVLPWAWHALHAGGTTHVPVSAPLAFPAPGPLDLPGSPVPVPTPGHTLGHCGYLLPRSGILISGDALVTAHPTSRVEGPQLLPDMFHSDRARALDSLSELAAVDADVIVPGHGPVHDGPPKDAAIMAFDRAH